MSAIRTTCTFFDVEIGSEGNIPRRRHCFYFDGVGYSCMIKYNRNNYYKLSLFLVRNHMNSIPVTDSLIVNLRHVLYFRTSHLLQKKRHEKKKKIE